MLDFPDRSLHPKSAPPIAGTKHLVFDPTRQMLPVGGTRSSGPDPSTRSLRIQRVGSILQIVEVANAQVVVQFVDDRLASRNLKAGDVGVRNLREMLDQTAQRIAVRGDQHPGAALERRSDPFLPTGQDP